MTTPLALLQSQCEGIEFAHAGAIFCVDGTVYPGAPNDPPPGAGFSSDIAYGLMDACDGLWQQVFIGYPAAVTPMAPSVQLGRSSTVYAITQYANAYHAVHGRWPWIVLSGYSQGAMVTNQVWVRDILPQGGSLHYLLPYVLRLYQFGDPYRTPGIAHGNELAGTPMPTKRNGAVTGGIGGPADLRAAESNVVAVDGNYVVCSFARDGDIYAACPVGDDPWTKMAPAGKVGNSIFKVIMQATFMDVIAVAGALFAPVGMVEEMINGMQFAAAGTNAPHWQYWPEMNAAINEMVLLGKHIRGY